MGIRRFGFFLALVCAAGWAAAGATFSGSWKLDLSKSHFAGQTFTIEKTPSGLYHFDSQGFGYDFDLTGKEYPAPDGGSSSWKATNANTWDAAIHMNGKTIASYHLVLKGNSLDSTMKVTRPDGTTAEQTTNNTRVSGGPGFLGKWKSGDPKGAATTLEISTDAANHITVKYPEFQMVCTGSLDGKDYVPMVAGAVSKQAIVFEKTGPNSIRMTTKLNGKPFYLDVLTLSDDGKTLTDDGNPVSANEPSKAVYLRQ
jgi:hypothetical protein